MDSAKNGTNQPTRGRATISEILGTVQERKKAEKPRRLTQEEYERREAAARHEAAARANAHRVEGIVPIGRTHPVHVSTYVPPVRS